MPDIVLRDTGSASVRIGTAERERAAQDLGEHFAAGRLDEVEFDQRVASAYQARTAGDLAPLFVDLPGPAADRRSRPSAAPRRRPTLRPVILTLFVLAAVAWVAIVHRPPFFVFVPLWFVLARSLHHRRRYWAARY